MSTQPIQPTHYNEPRMRDAYLEGYRAAKAEDAALLEAAKAAEKRIVEISIVHNVPGSPILLDKLRAAIAAYEEGKP